MWNVGIRSSLLRKAAYWRWRQKGKKGRFWARRTLHSIFGGLHTGKSAISIHARLLRLLIGKLITVSSIAGLILYLDWKVVPQYTDYNVETGTALISLLAQIFGVLLGLYFATLGVVVGTAYSQVPEVVRRIFVEEEVNNVYLAQVVNVTLLCVFMLAGSTAGIRPGMLSLVVVTLAGAYGIYNVGILGKRIFVFLDTRQLMEYPKREFLRNAANATPDGLFWDDASFQAHYERRAEVGLEAIESIVRLVIMGQRSEMASVQNLAAQALELFSAYCGLKSRIPSDSRWFRREARYPNWMLASEIEVIMALQTGRGVQPKEVPDHMWVERRLTRVVEECLVSLLKENHLRGMNDVYSRIQIAVGSVAHSFCPKESAMLMDLAQMIAMRVDGKTVPAMAARNADGARAFQIAIHDSYHSEVSAALIGIMLRIRDVSPGSVKAAVETTRWSKKGSIYREIHPVQVRKQYEHLSERLEFEANVEKEIVSPDWYMAQLVGIGYMEWLDESMGIVLEQYEARAAMVSKHVKDAEYLSAAAGIQQGLEAYEKLKQHMASMKKWSEDFSVLSRVGDIPWPKIEWDEWRDKADAGRRRLVRHLGDVAGALTQGTREENIPDYFGFAYTWLENECHIAMTGGQGTEFAALFPPYFVAAITMHEKVKKELTGQSIETVAVHSGESLENLLVLSGYAMLYSEIQGESYWASVKNAWDIYLAGNDSRKTGVLECINAIHGYRREVFGIMPRASIRANWETHFEGVLRELGLLDEWPGHGHIDARSKNAQKSNLVSALAGGRYWHYNPRDIFIAAYLSRVPGSETIEWGGPIASIRKEIERMEEGGQTPHG